MAECQGGVGEGREKEDSERGGSDWVLVTRKDRSS